MSTTQLFNSSDAFALWFMGTGLKEVERFQFDLLYDCGRIVKDKILGNENRVDDAPCRATYYWGLRKTGTWLVSENTDQYKKELKSVGLALGFHIAYKISINFNHFIGESFAEVQELTAEELRAHIES